jgi:hypothetical protein
MPKIVLAPGLNLELVTTPDDWIPTLQQVEIAHIQRALPLLHWNLSLASRVLGIDRRTLYRKMKKFGIERGQEKTIFVDPAHEGEERGTQDEPSRTISDAIASAAQ